MKKFLIFSSYLPSILNFRGDLIAAIADRGYEIHILAPDLEQFSKDHDKLMDLSYHVHSVPMQRVGTNPVADIETVIAVLRLIHRIKPTFMLSYTIKPVIYGTLAAALAQVPNRHALITGLGYAFQDVEETSHRSILQKIVQKLYQRALSNASKVFFQNPDDLQLFKELKLLKSSTPAVVVNGSGVNMSKFDVMPLPHDDAGYHKPSFLLIARLLNDKGIIEYVEAARKIKQKHPAVEFHLVGGLFDNPAAISQQQLDAWLEEGVFTYWGQVDDVRAAISECSVYVLPSYREGTPRTVLEAMSMGRSIITTDAPGCRETVVDGENGFLVPVRDVDSLAQAMLRFIEQPELMLQMGQRSRKIVEEKYDVHKVNAYMISEMELE